MTMSERILTSSANKARALVISTVLIFSLAGCSWIGGIETRVQSGDTVVSEVEKIRVELEAIGDLYEKALSQIGEEIREIQSQQANVRLGVSEAMENQRLEGLRMQLESLREDRTEILQYHHNISVDIERYIEKKKSELSAILGIRL